MKKYLILFIIISFQIYSQEDYRKWLVDETKKFKTFQIEEDNKFYDFLKKEWRQFDLIAGNQFDLKSKPDNIPQINNLNSAGSQNQKKIIITTKSEEIDHSHLAQLKTEPFLKSKISISGTISISSREGFLTRVIEIMYLDGTINVTYPEIFLFDIGNKISNKRIAEIWKQLSLPISNDFINNLLLFKNLKCLNDWGYFELVNQLSEKIFKEESPESKVLTWFILAKSGYKVKIGLNGNNPCLFVKSQELIYDLPYIKDVNDERTYLLNFRDKKNFNGNLLSYEGDYPNSDLLLSLKITEVPILEKEIYRKTFMLNYDAIEYLINAQLNKNIINYYKDYPSTQYDTYFEAKVSEEISSSLIEELKNKTFKMNEIETINFLLRFVQTCFGYKTDQQNFGREKALFVEETLFYPESDCEDRSILFAFLIKTVLGLKVIGIDYPGHVATAVQLTREIEGDYVNYNGNKFIICDPTYINANAGISMPVHPLNSIENIIEIK